MITHPCSPLLGRSGNVRKDIQLFVPACYSASAHEYQELFWTGRIVVSNFTLPKHNHDIEADACVHSSSAVRYGYIDDGHHPERNASSGSRLSGVSRTE